MTGPTRQRPPLDQAGAVRITEQRSPRAYPSGPEVASRWFMRQAERDRDPVLEELRKVRRELAALRWLVSDRQRRER